MTTELSILDWQDKPIRFIKEDEQTFVPVVDIAGAIGVDKRSCLRLLDRNSALFSSYERGVHLETLGGMQYTRCLNRDGTLGLLFKLSTNHVKDTAIREKLVEFQKWAIDKLSQVGTLHPTLPPTREDPDYPGIIERMKFVRAVHEETGWNLLELQKEVLREAGMISLTYHIEPEQKLPTFQLQDTSLSKPKDYLTAKDIGERIGKSAREVYMFLYNNHLLIMSPPGGWRLTEAGKEFGSEYAVEVGQGAIVWRIRWKKDILRLFNVFDHEEMG